MHVVTRYILQYYYEMGYGNESRNATLSTYTQRSRVQYDRNEETRCIAMTMGNKGNKKTNGTGTYFSVPSLSVIA